MSARRLNALEVFSIINATFANYHFTQRNLHCKSFRNYKVCSESPQVPIIDTNNLGTRVKC